LKKILFLIVICSTLCGASYAVVEGYDWWSSLDWVEFEEDCFREGDDIYMYDWRTSNYHIVEIENIDCYQDGCEVEIYDWELSEYRSIELEEDLCQ